MWFARLGGDEFGMLFAETDATGAKGATEKIQTLLKEAMAENGWPVTFSIGVVTFDEPPTGIDEVIKDVDRIMYTVKHAGKDGVEYMLYSMLDKREEATS